MDVVVPVMKKKKVDGKKEKKKRESQYFCSWYRCMHACIAFPKNCNEDSQLFKVGELFFPDFWYYSATCRETLLTR